MPGKEQCGYYDINPAKQALSSLYVDSANKTDKHEKYHYARYWDGLTISGSGRLPRNISLGGGVDFGKNVSDHCFTIDMPNQPNDINNLNFAGGVISGRAVHSARSSRAGKTISISGSEAASR